MPQVFLSSTPCDINVFQFLLFYTRFLLYRLQPEFVEVDVKTQTPTTYPPTYSQIIYHFPGNSLARTCADYSHQGYRFKEVGTSRPPSTVCCLSISSFPPGSHTRDESIHLPRHILPHLPEYSWARQALTKWPGLTSFGNLVPLYHTYARAVTLHPH